MEEKIINVTNIREAVDAFDNRIYGWVAMDELQSVAIEQNDLLIKAADRIEELETGIRNLLKKYQGR